MVSITRPLSRLSACVMRDRGRARQIVLELDPRTPTLVGFRLKGCRATYYLPIDACYRDAVRCELARRKAERRKARAEAKGA